MLKIERMTFINAKGVCNHGFTISDDDIVGYDNSWDQLPDSGTRGDDLDLMEHALHSFPEFFDKSKNEGFLLEVDDVTYNYVEFADYLRNINSKESLDLLREGF